MHVHRRQAMESTTGTLVQFELEVCTVAKVNLTGLRFRRKAGDTWAYKALCDALIGHMVL